MPQLLALAVLVTCVGGMSVASASAGDRPSPARADTADPAGFTLPRANPWFPLEPGTVSRYRGGDEGERFRERVIVTDRTKVIEGVTTTVLRDVVLRSDGSVAERTRDWYAADNDGTVWYFGEAEDQAWIVQRGVTTTVPYGVLHGAVRTFEWSRLEKDVVSAKLYAPGLGIVREHDVSGGDETFVLVGVRRR